MNEQKLQTMLAGLEPWQDDFGSGMEYRSHDGLSWYDLSLQNSWPCEPKVAVIVTAWYGQLKYLAKTLESYRRSGAYVILAYDNPFLPWMRPSEHNVIRCLPNQKHFTLAHSVVFKHITYDASKRNGWFWDVRYAQGILKQFKNIEYVYCTNGDCIWDRPEGLNELVGFVADGDLMPGQQTESTYHTAAVLYKIDAFNKIFDYAFETMKTSIIGSHSAENLLRDAVHQLKLKVVKAPIQPLDKDGTIDMYSRYGQNSTLKSVVGYRNLFAEQETAWNNSTEPLPASYVDDYMDWIYFSGDEKDSLCKFYKNGDRRYLYQYWDKGSDSDYNRLYYPIEAYGTEPIYEVQPYEPVYAHRK